MGESPDTTPIPVIGIAGGIGSGKSTAARAFEELGCYVIDFDADVQAALETEGVSASLAELFGADVFDSSGRVDRGAVARIVFANEAARKKLERLLHPIVWRTKAEAIAEGQAADPDCRGVIMDAPLLFEAGLHKECDALVFVHTPRDIRLQRVRESRGWSEEEFADREAAQIPNDEKRSRCGYIIANHDGSEDLQVQAGRILAILQKRRGATAS